MTELSNTPTAPAQTPVPLAFVPGMQVACDHCPGSLLRSTRISTAFWQDDGLVVIRNIPAMVCPDCGEEYVEDDTVVALDRLRGAGFDGCAQIAPLSVPVFDFAASGPCVGP